jgi:multisubunit Na+/H+ antiporter MnhC subunit
VVCGCFGTSEPRDYRLLLLRNAVLAGVASIAAFGGADAPRLTLPALPTAADALPAALVVTGLVVTAWVLTSSIRSLRTRRTT